MPAASCWFGLTSEGSARGLARLTEPAARGACDAAAGGHSYLSLASSEGVIFAPAPQVEAVSAIGSGDAYLAGLLAGLFHRDLPPVEAIRLAAGCAAANAETLGAGLFETRRAEELAGEVRVETRRGRSAALEPGRV